MSGNRNSQGDRLPLPDPRSADLDQKLFSRLQVIISSEQPYIDRVTTAMLRGCEDPLIPGVVDMKRLCAVFLDVWQKSFDLASTVTYQGYDHIIVVWLFTSICKRAMTDVFASDDFSGQRSTVAAFYRHSLIDLFSKIQHVFQSPNARPGDAWDDISIRFHRMTPHELRHMLRNWLAHPADNLDHISAERMSLNTLRFNIVQLFHNEGGVDMAREAIVEYEAFRFDNAWATAVADMNINLRTWLSTWWAQKMELLYIAVHRACLDHMLRRRLDNQHTMGTLPYVIPLLTAWDPSGTRLASEFTVSMVQQYAGFFVSDRRIIDVAFAQLPHSEPNWKIGQSQVLTKPLEFNTFSVPPLSSASFATLEALRAHTAKVTDIVIPDRMSSGIAKMALGYTQLTQDFKDAEIERLRAQTKSDAETIAKLQHTSHNTFQQSHSYGFPGVNNSNVIQGYGSTSSGQLVGISSLTGGGYEELDEIESDFRYLPINNVDYAVHLSATYGELFETIKIPVSDLKNLYPSSIQQQCQTIVPRRDGAPARLTVSALAQYIRRINDVSLSQNLALELCNVVNTVYKRLGGTHGVGPQDLSGCQRPVPPAQHLCQGSHGTLSCPQAMLGGLPSPAFRKVHDMVSPEKLLQKCQQSQTNKHEPATCLARLGQYRQCVNCKSYIFHEVYPVSLGIMWDLLSLAHTSETDKHEHRVQLAVGLLNAVWSGIVN